MGLMRFIVFLGLVVALPPALADLRPYGLDPDGAKVEFTYWVNGQPGQGTIPVLSADLRIDVAALERSRAEVWLDARGTRTNAVFVTQALKSDSVLATARFPTIHFVSRSVRSEAPGRARILGEVTIRGITRPMVLQAQIYRQHGSAPDDLRRLSVHLSGHVSRSTFGGHRVQRSGGRPGGAVDSGAIGVGVILAPCHCCSFSIDKMR